MAVVEVLVSARAVEVLTRGPDAKPYINLEGHRPHGVANAAFLVVGDFAGGRVECGCGERFALGAVRPEPLEYLEAPVEGDGWTDELEEATTLPCPPTRVLRRAGC